MSLMKNLAAGGWPVGLIAFAATGVAILAPGPMPPPSTATAAASSPTVLAAPAVLLDR